MLMAIFVLVLINLGLTTALAGVVYQEFYGKW